ncbi:MAG: HD domain-containing protein [Planctomycetes bacterium]|uniref:HD-GYP domain-containing protein n=1 Tax=Candidatus Wunengus sp. YC65 TaxID=3367701 RepID=UPI001D52B26E|nr:HD domain-containing protein [Planctomycetota bacterium]
MSGTVEYIPVTLNAIRVDTIVGCDLYLQNHINNEVSYVLYCSGTNVVKSDKIEDLQRHSVKTLFIRKEDKKIYLKYVESSLKHIINDGRVDVKEKAYIVYDVAKNIMEDVFEDPRSGEQVERSKSWVSNTIDFIIRSKGSFSGMMSMISYDYYTYTHSVNVSVLGLLFAKYLGLDGGEMQVFGTGLLLHDVGKTQIDPAIINKKERLNDEEFARIKMHVDLGADILKQTGGVDSTSFFPIMQHHEKYNGKGYPNGLKGDAIHKYGRIAGIIDVYDALTTQRSYSDARKPFAALKIMNEEMKESFDEKYFKDFILFLGSGGERQYQKSKKKFPMSV